MTSSMRPPAAAGGPGTRLSAQSRSEVDRVRRVQGIVADLGRNFREPALLESTKKLPRKTGEEKWKHRKDKNGNRSEGTRFVIVRRNGYGRFAKPMELKEKMRILGLRESKW